MNIFKTIPLLIQLSRDINKAMEDRLITAQEVIAITNNALFSATGKTLKDIGVRITKTEHNKTKIEMVF